MSGNHSKAYPALIVASLALLTFALYWRVHTCDYVWLDDVGYITWNPQVKAGLTWAGVKWAFQSHECNWHPLTWISHMTDCQIFGVKPEPQHLVNLLFHIANVVLLFFWLRRLTGAVWKSALVAALFAWHPLHVESVAWIAERKDVLSTFFWLLTLLAYGEFKSHGPRRWIWYAITLLFFALGLLSKPMVVTMPFVLLLVDYWIAAPGISALKSGDAPVLSKLQWKKWIAEKIPFFALSAASCVATMQAQQEGGAVTSLQSVPFEQRLANAIISYVRYLNKTVWPDDLAVFYPHPTSWNWSLVAGAALLLLTICWWVLRERRRRPWLAVGWLLYLGTLVPVIGLVQVGSQSIADRYMYIPSIGLFIIAAWELEEFLEWSKARLMPVALAIMALIVCIGLTWRQIGFWKESETLFKHDVAAVGDNYVACSDLGFVLMLENRMDESLFYYKKALATNPGFWGGEYALGNALIKHGDIQEGAEHLLKAVQLSPDVVEAHFNLARAYANLGKLSEAVEQYRAVTTLRPQREDAHKELSGVLARNGDLSAAIEELTVVAQTNPHDAQIQEQLASLFSRQHDVPQAIGHFQEAARIYRDELQHNPGSVAPLNNLAWLLATNPYDKVRNGAEAVTLARRACDVTHWKEAILIGTLAAACAESGQFDEAVGMANKAHETALAAGQKEIAARNEELLKRYQRHEPCRQQAY